ncbi:hypothetical protein C7408_104367, partial [Paraburkholderia caballeronis]
MGGVLIRDSALHAIEKRLRAVPQTLDRPANERTEFGVIRQHRSGLRYCCAGTKSIAQRVLDQGINGHRAAEFDV